MIWRLLIGTLVAASALLNVQTASALDANNFRITNFVIDYKLTQDADGHSRLKTTEKITAVFPNFDQNHGLERAIPARYDNHTTGLAVASVLRPDGSPWEYSTYEQNGNTIVRIGDAGSYVHGEQTFVIAYTQRNVTRYFEDTQRDEFYWDTNGTDWKVPIDRLEVTLTVDDKVTGALTGDIACYKGAESDDTKCSLNRSQNVFTTQAAALAAGENVTIAVGFDPHTFMEYEPPLWERLFVAAIIFMVVVGLVAIGLMVWVIIRWANWSNRKQEIGTIVPEYIPPADASIATVASLATSGRPVFTAQLLDFAVRHYIKIYETGKKSLFRQAKYEIEITKDISKLKAEEQEILADIFGGNVAVGQRLDLGSLQNNTAVYKRTLDNDKKLTALIRGDYGLRQRSEAQSAWFKKTGWVLLAVAVVLLNPLMLIAALTAFICGYTLWPLTDKGMALYRYAQGMKLYIGVAEKERLQMLQSPEGACKVAVDTNDTKQLVKLYERMLPYAVLFGQEKEWAKRIGDLYEASRTTPEWYGGHSSFNAVVFATAMNNFSTSASYSSPSSSSSGGSGGGGFSGGGGGGGGGGGW